MKKFFKENWKFLLFVLFGGLIGGYCTGFYMYDLLSDELLKQLQEQNVTKNLLVASSMIQYGVLYGFLLALIGVVLSKKVNLWKSFRFDKNAVIVTMVITIFSALLLFPGDKIIFGSFSSWVAEQYTFKPTIYKIICGLFVGGIVEEVMLRLFFMSLVVFVISKLFCKKEFSVKVYVIANIISAILFAAGHLPSTSTMTTLTPLLIIRCFLFNGGIGLGFGYLYRKYGIGYSMLSHALVHLISDLLMIVFI